MSHHSDSHQQLTEAYEQVATPSIHRFQWEFTKPIPKDVQARIIAKLMPHGQAEWKDDHTLHVVKPEDVYSTDAHVRILMGFSGGLIKFTKVA